MIQKSLCECPQCGSTERKWSVFDRLLGPKTYQISCRNCDFKTPEKSTWHECFEHWNCVFALSK